jgi:hypothetical protein
MSAFHKFTQNIGINGTIFLVRVAVLYVSNYSLERMAETHGLEAYFLSPRSIQCRSVPEQLRDHRTDIKYDTAYDLGGFQNFCK